MSKNICETLNSAYRTMCDTTGWNFYWLVDDLFVYPLIYLPTYLPIYLSINLYTLLSILKISTHTTKISFGDLLPTLPSLCECLRDQEREQDSCIAVHFHGVGLLLYLTPRHCLVWSRSRVTTVIFLESDVSKPFIIRLISISHVSMALT